MEQSRQSGSGLQAPIVFVSHGAPSLVLEGGPAAQRLSELGRMLELGQRLAPLAEQGVALIGSGSLTHNLRDTRFGETRVLEYAQRFQDWVRGILQGPHEEAVQALLNPKVHTPDFKRAHPYDDHYLPLLFALGAAGLQSANPTVYSSPIMHAALSMDSYRWSGKPGAL